MLGPDAMIAGPLVEDELTLRVVSLETEVSDLWRYVTELQIAVRGIEKWMKLRARKRTK